VEPGLRPTHYYRWLYERRGRELGFNATSLEEWREWRARLREKLVELLGGLRYPRRDPSPAVKGEWHRGGVTVTKLEFWSDEFNLVPAYLLKPRTGGEAAVLALHGHGYGKEEITGFDAKGQPRSIGEGYQKDFAFRLAERGFTVLAIDQCGFGERREEEDVERGADASSCWQLSTWALLYGENALGRRVWDAMRSIDFLEGLNWVRPGRIGVMGISGGGTTALFTSALDDRVAATVVSGYLNTFKDSILSIRHCIDNYVPGILKYAEMYDVAALIAPRPLFIEAGARDPIFPLEPALRAAGVVRRAYELLGAAERFVVDVFDGGHEIHGEGAFKFLEKWLRSGA